MARHRKPGKTIRLPGPRAGAALSVLAAGAAALGVALSWSPGASHPVSYLKPLHLTAPALTVAVQAPEPAPARMYVVRGGDTLWSVAARECGNGNDWRKLASASRIGDGSSLRPGQVITVAC